jgi:hypothetical protein
MQVAGSQNRTACIFDVWEKTMTTDDNQRILNEQLRQATESDDPQSEIGLVLLHYHQAMISAAKNIKACDACAASVDIPQLQATAAEIEQRNYGSYQELQRIAKARLGQASRLCNACKAAYKEALLERFVQLHRAP